MTRQIVFSAALVAALIQCDWISAAPQNGLIPETTALRHGLTRPWFTQVQMDAGGSRVRYAVLDDGTLFVQTDRAIVHAINAETGQTLWAKQIGRPNHPSMTPGLNRDLLVVVNGSRLYAVNRVNGDLLFETQVGGPPGAGAAVSDKRAYVPMVTGMVMAYRLEPMTDPLKELGKVQEDMTDEEKAAAAEARRENLRLRQEYIPPLACQSLGHALVQPVAMRQTNMEEYVSWPTDRGFLNVGRIDKRSEEALSILYRLETAGGIPTRPVYTPPDPKIAPEHGVLFVASTNGFVYAVLERTGDTLWRFSAGEPVVQEPVLIDDQVFVAVQTGGLYCLEAKSGADRWWSPQACQFIAASKDRVYATDRSGRILALNAKTGARLDTLTGVETAIKVVNSETDRLYLLSDRGLVQGLREIEQTRPFMHNESRKQPTAEAKGEDAAAARAKKPAGKGKEKEPAAEEGEGEKPPTAGKKDGEEADPFETAPKGGAAKGGAAKGGAAKGGAKGGAKEGENDGGATEDPFK